MSRYVMFLLTVCLMVACGGQPTTPPDLVGTEVAVQRAAAATLTSEAPAPTEYPPTATVGEETAGAPTSTSTATQVPVETRAASPTSRPTATPRPATPTARPATATVEPLPPAGGAYAVVGVESDDVLNVRSAAGVAHRIVGTIPPYGTGVQVVGTGAEVDGSVWVPIRHAGTAGWVNSRYLARQVGSVDQELAARAAQAIMALKHQDMASLSRLVDPDNGVRFSPYTYVRAEAGAPGGSDRVLSAEELRHAFSDETTSLWGWYDGSGEPIELTFSQYYGRFVYNADFAHPHVVGFNETIGQGNTINNIAEAYPGASTVEYHFEGFDPQYAGMDWSSLRLVFDKVGGVWVLVGIVHDEWTI